MGGITRSCEMEGSRLSVKWPRGARVAKKGRLAIERVSPKRLAQRADQKLAKEKLAAVRIMELWYCPTHRGHTRHPDLWIHKGIVKDETTVHCEKCEATMIRIPGVFREETIA